MKEKIQLYILSGFLGAGKTTLLKRLLAQFGNKKLGVIVNEFGAIGVDGQTISRDGLSLVEINNGSIFCSCLKANFTKTLVAMQKQDIEMLIIENSGLADPSAMNKLLREMAPYMETGYDYKGSICLVDATTFMDYVDVLMPVENQILASDVIIINKTDLTSAKAVAQVKSRVRELNPDAVLLEAVQADVSIEEITGCLKNGGAEGELTSCSWNSPESYTLACRGTYPKEALESYLRQLLAYAARIKGFVHTGEGWMLADAVGRQVCLTPAEIAEGNVPSQRGLVILGKTDKPFDAEAIRLWEGLMQEKAELTVE